MGLNNYDIEKSTSVIRINPYTREEVKYNSIREAARENKTYHSNIRTAIRTNGFCVNYKWKYANEP